MTEPLRIEPAVDDERAARLARLAARRGADRPPLQATPDTNPTAAVTSPPPSSPAPTVAPRRRSPARDAKIVTVGASTTALLGIIAGFGIADGRSAEPATTAAPEPVPGSPGLVPPASASSTPPAAAAPTAPPQLIVVLVDAATGRTLGTTTDGATSAEALELSAAPAVATDASAPSTVDTPATDSVPSTSVAPPAGAPAAAVPVAAEPATVDLAVPAPPPAAAPASAPAAAPQPQATSSGS